MKKNLLFKIAIGIASFSVAVPVFADDEGTVPVPPPPKPELRQEVKNIRQDAQDTRQEMKKELIDAQQNAREELKNAKQEMETDVKELRNAARQEMENAKQSGNTEEMQAKREELKAMVEQKREELKAMAEQKREEFKQKLEDSRAEMKARMETKKQELKDRLEVIKDEKKKAIVEKVDGRLDELNAKYLSHFSDVLEKISGVMIKINVRVEKAAANGLDVSAVRTAITTAESAIAASKTAIVSQSSKTYPIAVSDEATLRQNVDAARQALRADLQTVAQTVKDAKEAVRGIATALANIQGINEIDEEPSSTETATTETQSQDGTSETVTQ